MTTKMFLNLLSVFLFSVLTFTACSSDNDDENGGENFKINGENYTVDSSQCEEADYIAFSTMFRQGQTVYEFIFRVYGIYDFESLNVNDDITEDIYIRSFRELTDFNSSDFDDDNIKGKVIVKSITNSTVVIEFTNFEFIKDSNSKKYLFNGKINYKRI